MSISCIYKIINTINGKIYIGQTNDFYRRISQHKNKLRQNKHFNQHLQFAWNKYGEKNFTFEIIEECEIDRLNEKEMYWIKKLHTASKHYGYNISCEPHSVVDKNLSNGKNYTKIICLNNMVIYDCMFDILNSPLNPTRVGVNASIRKHATSGELDGIPCVWMQYNTFKESSIEEIQHIFNTAIYKLEHRCENISKKVVLLNTKETFDSMSEASIKYNVDNSTIAKCCKGTQYFAGIKDGVKLVWVTEEVFKTMSDKEIEDKINEVNSRKQKTTGKKVICVELNEVFESIIEASRILKERGFISVSPSSLADNLKERCDHGGYDSNRNPLHWKYLE